MRTGGEQCHEANEVRTKDMRGGMKNRFTSPLRVRDRDVKVQRVELAFFATTLSFTEVYAIGLGA